MSLAGQPEQAYPDTTAGIMALPGVPAVAIDQTGSFIFINRPFTDEFGWTEDDLLGKSVTTIMPPHMRDAHIIGLSRFLATEKPAILGRALPLDTLYKDGRVAATTHYIVGDRHGGEWRFAALIMPSGGADA